MNSGHKKTLRSRRNNIKRIDRTVYAVKTIYFYVLNLFAIFSILSYLRMLYSFDLCREI